MRTTHATKDISAGSQVNAFSIRFALVIRSELALPRRFHGIVELLVAGAVVVRLVRWGMLRFNWCTMYIRRENDNASWQCQLDLAAGRRVLSPPAQRNSESTSKSLTAGATSEFAYVTGPNTLFCVLSLVHCCAFCLNPILHKNSLRSSFFRTLIWLPLLPCASCLCLPFVVYLFSPPSTKMPKMSFFVLVTRRPPAQHSSQVRAYLCRPTPVLTSLQNTLYSVHIVASERQPAQLASLNFHTQ